MINLIQKLRAMLSPAGDPIRFVGEMQRLQLQPDDVVIISHEGPLSNKTAELIKGYLLRKFPEHQVIILSDGLKIGAVGPGSQSMASLIKQQEDGQP